MCGAVIYGLCTTAAVGAALYALGGLVLWSAVLLPWSWVNYRILISGRKSGAADEDGADCGVVSGARSAVCPYCGAALSRDALFCGSCGARVARDTAESAREE